jgi:hypothetical protein
MNDLIPVPRYEDGWAIIVLSCGHGRLINAAVGHAVWHRRHTDTWLCGACDGLGTVTDVIERKPCRT